MAGYTDTIRRWAADTRRAGLLAEADGTGEVGLDASEAGRKLAVRFTVKTALGRVTDVRFQVFGCGFTIAACAAAAELAVGLSLDELPCIDAARLDAELGGLPGDRRYCAEFASEALKAAGRSARQGRHPVLAKVGESNEHGPRVTPENRTYHLLMQSSKPAHVANEDRHLFACLLAAAGLEAGPATEALGLSEEEIAALVRSYFPKADRAALDQDMTGQTVRVEPSKEVLEVLLDHVPKNLDPLAERAATWLAHMIAARAARPGHLWVAMGLFDRAELSAAIRRHLPALAAANVHNMRWKRFLFKQVCDRQGGVMCKAPNCGVCSDYALCFDPT